jgi:hypothetical protein
MALVHSWRPRAFRSPEGLAFMQMGEKYPPPIQVSGQAEGVDAGVPVWQPLYFTPDLSLYILEDWRGRIKMVKLALFMSRSLFSVACLIKNRISFLEAYILWFYHFIILLVWTLLPLTMFSKNSLNFYLLWSRPRARYHTSTTRSPIKNFTNFSMLYSQFFFS